MSKTLEHYLDELQISTSITIQIFIDTPHEVLPERDYFSNWECLDCGAKGKRKGKYESTLKERVRAHQYCRCKARFIFPSILKRFKNKPLRLS